MGQSKPLNDALASAFDQSQVDIETEKSALARTLHDDLGGLLVGAIMDIGWVSQQPGLSASVRDKIMRAQSLIRAAIDLKRELIESIRPTLLDNVGLFSTLRWHMKVQCDAARVPYTETFPDIESAMSSEVKISAFRIFQDALKDVLSTYTPGDLALKVEMIGDTLHCHLIHRAATPGRDPDPAAASPETAMRYRAQRVGGSMGWSKTAAGSHLDLWIPLTVH